MPLFPRSIPVLAVVLAVTAASAYAPALAANAPPVSAPRDPVEVSPLPPVRDTAETVGPPPSAPTAVPATPPAERAWWQEPTFWAAIALIETVGAFIATILYMRKPEQNRLVLALAMTGGSAVFIIVALVAWLL
jgi:hypothetical protein